MRASSGREGVALVFCCAAVLDACKLSGCTIGCQPAAWLFGVVGVAYRAVLDFSSLLVSDDNATVTRTESGSEGRDDDAPVFSPVTGTFVPRKRRGGAGASSSSSSASGVVANGEDGSVGIGSSAVATSGDGTLSVRYAVF